MSQGEEGTIQDIEDAEFFEAIKYGDINKAVEIYLKDRVDPFTKKEMYEYLEIRNLRHKKAADKVLEREAQRRELIEREARGVYRPIQKSCREMDILNPSTFSYDIRWPLGIENLFKTKKKNVIVLAGIFDSGKTAFCLNTAFLNMDKYDIYYFCSEMDDEELQGRILSFGIPLIDWKKRCHFKERSSNFADSIEPDAFNIIDYLEMSENFYEVNRKIADIWGRLKNGIALIALQKTKGKDMGRGGDFSAEKARLYLSMEYDHLKICKGKNWTDPKVDPKFLEIIFTIEKGKFVPLSEWHRPEKDGKTSEVYKETERQYNYSKKRKTKEQLRMEYDLKNRIDRED